MRLPATLAGFAALALASAGHAEPAAKDDLQALRAAVYLASSSRNVSAPITRIDAAGIARTAVERKIADNGLTGGLGFMCGGARTYNPTSPLGNDPAGRFIGARLGLSF